MWGGGSVYEPSVAVFCLGYVEGLLGGSRRRFFQGPMSAPGGEHSAFRVEGRHIFFSACDRTGKAPLHFSLLVLRAT